MSYIYGASQPAANTYQHSPYIAQGAAAAPHSPYAAPGVVPHSPYVAAGAQPGATGYQHSPYASTPSSGATLVAPGAYPGQATQASPMVGQMFLPSGGQLTVGAGAVAAATSPVQPAQPFMANVTPGAVTYTTTTDAQGRTVYHHFKAEPATYRSPQGVTYTGIQWVPTETSFTPPVGVAPAGPDVLASFRGQIPTVPDVNAQGAVMPGGGRDYRDDGLKSNREWEKEERRRRKEEKAASKRAAAWEAEQIAREKAEDRELRKARERDAAEFDRASRMRRPSYGAGLGAGPNTGAGAYNRERSRDRGDLLRERELREREERQLERQMGDLDVGGGRGPYAADFGAPAPGTRSRRQSMSRPTAAGGIYDEPVYDRDRDEYGERNARRRSNIYAPPEPARDVYSGSARSRPASIYGPPERERAGRPSSVYVGPERSPYRRDASPLPTSLRADGVEVYPSGHILAGQPVSGSGYAPSRRHSPVPGAAPYPSGGLSANYGASPRMGGSMMSAHSPRVGGGAIPGLSPRMGGAAPLAGDYGSQQLMAAPEAFSRPINRAQTFTPFKDLYVQDLEDIADNAIDSMPAVLGTHDVLPEDWMRLLRDIALAWQGRLPVPPTTGPMKRSDLVIDLLDSWNASFFLPRCAELILYKGRNAKSGAGAGLPETRLAPEQLAAPGEFSDSEDESEEESEEEFPPDQYGGAYGSHRGHAQHDRAHGSRRVNARAARRKQKMEVKVQREMEMNKRYTLWLRFVDPRDY